MELNVNDYIRTNDGKIAKFIKYDEEDKNELVTDYYEYSTIWIGDVVKASPNILDLIQCCDYINGLPVYEDKDYVKFVQSWDGHAVDINKIVIENILTREQFESMEYKVGE